MKTLRESILDGADKIIDKTSNRVESKLYKKYFPGSSRNIKWDPSTRTVTSLRGDYLYIYNDNGVPSVYIFNNGDRGKYVSCTEALPRSVTFNCNLNVPAEVLVKTNFKLSDIPNVHGKKLRIALGDYNQAVTPAKIRNFIDCKPNFKILDYRGDNKRVSDILRLDCMGWFDGVEFNSNGYRVSDKEKDEFFNTTGIKAKMIWIQKMNFTLDGYENMPRAAQKYKNGTLDKNNEYYKLFANILKLLTNNPKLTIGVAKYYNGNENTTISLSNKGELTFKEN